MSSYSQRIEALENNEKKKKLLFTVIVVLLIIIFLGGMVIGAQNVLNTEGTYDPYAITATEPKKLALTAQDIISSFSSALKESAEPDRTKLSVYTDVEIPDDSISVESGDESLLMEIKYIKPKILESIKGYYETYTGKFGEDFSEHLIPAAFSEKNITSAECVQGKLNDEGGLTDFDKVFCTVNFPQADFDGAQGTPLFDSFGMEISKKIRDTFAHDIKSIASAESIEIVCSDFFISFETDKESGRVNSVLYNRGYTVALVLTFKGDLEKLGAQKLSFNFYAKESHLYTWAGVKLSEHELSLEKGDVEAIEAFRETDDDVDVKWTSSAPDIASVDEKGYVKGRAVSKDPVTVTAEISYRGITYTDSCTVFVRKPVKEIKLSAKELHIKPGEEAQLSAQISPKSATIHNVLWFSEDESIASVDENGIVTANSTGDTKIFAVSVDGFFRSSCAVTVVD